MNVQRMCSYVSYDVNARKQWFSTRVVHKFSPFLSCSRRDWARDEADHLLLRPTPTKPDSQQSLLPDMASFNKLSRAMTFDDRKVANRAAENFKAHEFTKLQKRAMTFAEKTETTPGARERAQSLSVPDVMFRRHFGQQDRDPKPFSVMLEQGIKSSDIVAPAVRRQDEDNSGKAVVVTDTFTTGALLANTLYKMGYKVICVLSADLKDLLKMIPEGLEVSFEATITLDNEIDAKLALDSVIEQIHAVGIPIVAVFAGAETGVELADALSEAMGLRTNGTQQTDARRNKYVMGETIRAAGLRAVKQLRATAWGEIAAWLEEWNPFPFKVIVKPVDSAGSDDVTLCLSLEEVQAAFGNIMGKINGLGLVNRSVLVQEYLEGQEYILDLVSRDGEHKVAAVWAYDRRAVNGAGFVCFGQRLLTADEPHVRDLIAYQKKVITALGIRNGPTHGEVKWFQGEPVLVEVGARCQGADGLWVKITTEALGYNQVECAIDSYLYPDRFAAMPAEPLVRQAHAMLKWLICYENGTLRSANARTMQAITSDPSYRGHQLFIQPGGAVRKTQNCFTWGGCVLLANRSEADINEYYERMERYEKQGELFDVDVASAVGAASEEVRDAVVIIDPFSTGAVLAADLCAQGFKVVALYSANLDHLVNVANLVPKGVTVSFEAIVPFDEDLAVLQARLAALPNLRVAAVLPGAETGVELADALSEAMGLRTNGTAHSEARRNKYVMGETIRAAGLRAVRQLRATTWAEMESFLAEWKPEPFKMIVKPLESAGSDDVTLCWSPAEVKAAFHRIMGKVNGLGMVNEAVLVQEYLEGQEYVLDLVSRDGEHKVAAVWAYDRRAVNGAGFVCFGQRLLTADEPHVRDLIAYQKKVITALGIRNGPTHGEVKWFQGEPVLVEVGARCHGAEGMWQKISKAVYGYDQVQCSIDACFFPERFAAMPVEPMERHSYGRLIFLILYTDGIVEDFDLTLLAEIEAMASFVSLELFCSQGGAVRKTVDCFTFGGVVRLLSDDQDTVLRDYERIREIEHIGFIHFAK